MWKEIEVTGFAGAGLVLVALVADKPALPAGGCGLDIGDRLYLSDRFNRIDTRLGRIERRVTRVGQRVGGS